LELNSNGRRSRQSRRGLNSNCRDARVGLEFHVIFCWRVGPLVAENLVRAGVALASAAQRAVAARRVLGERGDRSGIEGQQELAALLRREVDVWLSASRALESAAPEPRDDGWSELERPAIEAMKRHWGAGRDAYEHIEGAIAPLFPESEPPPTRATTIS
jgi:hypothetical protein